MMAKYEKFLNVDAEIAAFTPPPRDLATKAIHSGAPPGEWSSRAVMPPIHQSSVYELDDILTHKYYYTRFDNPSRNSLERVFAAMDDGKYAIVTSSGMSATTLLAMGLKAGDHVLLGFSIYEATYRLFTNVASKMGIESDFIPFDDLTKVKAGIKPNTKLVFFESLTNPTLRLFDIPAIVALVKGINKDIIIAVDNAFLTPYFLRVLNHGVDVAMYSVSKYYNGHSDVVQGSLVFNDEKLYQHYKGVGVLLGGCPGPMDCYLVERSIRTLPARMNLHFRNGVIVAKFLEQHPAVEKVINVALPSHQDHEKAKRLLNGSCGVVIFYIKNGSIEKVTKFFRALKVVLSAGSFGGVETKISCPFVAAAVGIPKELKAISGITESMIRISVGIEDPIDIMQDLDQALNLI